MKNILVVFTGGTIGSSVSEGTINTSVDTTFKLLQLFAEQNPSHQIRFSTIQPLNILSENLAPQALQRLINAIEMAKPNLYDGIIITHGTDTLAYTAAALSFYFNAITIPVLLVSSDYPLSDPRANGLKNFSCAVAFILQKIDNGIFVPYHNQGQTMQVHYGSRLTCSHQLTGDFYSVQGKNYLQFTDGKFSNIESLNQKRLAQSEKIQANFSERILIIRPYPGLDYRQFNLQNVDVVLHDLYHSGTACVTSEWGQQHSILEFIKTCKDEGIDVYLAPIIKSENAYKSTRDLIERGGKVIWNMSIETAYIKLMLAYGNFSDDHSRRIFLETNVCNEMVL